MWLSRVNGALRAETRGWHLHQGGPLLALLSFLEGGEGGLNGETMKEGPPKAKLREEEGLGGEENQPPPLPTSIVKQGWSGADARVLLEGPLTLGKEAGDWGRGQRAQVTGEIMPVGAI